MAKVIGLGGVFFKSQDPAAIKKWYIDHLGLPEAEDPDDPGISFKNSAQPASGFSVWGPFKADTQYFDPATREFMINLVVDDLDGVLQQVEKGGGTIVGDIEEYDFGRFGWFMDPDGNKVELWQAIAPQGA